MSPLRVIAIGLVVLAAALAPPRAAAHAVLMDSDPKARQVLDDPPSRVSVTFNESVGPVFFRVLDRSGREVGSPGEIQLDGTRMIMPLGAALPKGTYVMTYRVISADTHPVGATIVFAVGEPLAEASAMAAVPADTSSGWTWAVALNRWALYAAMLLAAGSALFLALLAVPAPLVAPTAALGRGAAVVAAIAYLLALGVGGAEMLLVGPGALFAGDAWARGLASTLAPSAAMGVIAMGLLWWALGRSLAAPAGGALLAGAAAAIASFLVTGHAATAPPVWLLATAVGVHLLATAFWFGALYPLLRSADLLEARDCGALMTRFSRLAAYAVIAVVVSGVLIGWAQLKTPANLAGNAYGGSLVRKLVLFVLVLGIAAYNKRVLTPALARGDATAARRIRRTIRVEFVLYTLVVGAAMSLTLSTPPRALAPQAAAAGGAAAAGDAMLQAEGFKATLKAPQGYSVELDLSPAKSGDNMLMATVKGPDGQVLTELAAVEAVVALESAGISDVRIKAQKVGNGMWHAPIQEMLIPGEWTLQVDAFVTDFDKVTFTTSVTIR